MRISDWSSDVCSSDLADQLDRWSLTSRGAGEWVNVDQVLTALRASIATTAAASVPTVGVAVEELTAALKELNRKADAVNLRRIEIHQARQLKDVDIASLEGRIASLKEDLQKNQDVQKL